MKSRHSIVLIMTVLLFAGCVKNRSVDITDQNQTDWEAIEAVAPSVATRDVNGLLEATRHSSEQIRSLAWRALAKSPVENSVELAERVVQANSREAWFALSYHNLSEQQFEEARNFFGSDPAGYSQICELFKRQGDVTELRLILQHLEDLPEKYECSMAAGRIITRAELPENDRLQVVDAAFSSSDPILRRNLLYGFYRNTLNRPPEGNRFYSILEEKWTDIPIRDEPATHQYMIGIMGSRGAGIFQERVGKLSSVENQQLLIEWIKQTQDVNALPEFLDHKNPNVVAEVLQRMKELNLDEISVLNMVYDRLVRQTRNSEIFVTAAELVQAGGRDLSYLSRKLTFMQNQNPYLTDRILALFRGLESEEEYLARIKDELNRGGIRGLHAAQALTRLWVDEDFPDTGFLNDIVMSSAETGDASVLTGLQTLLTDSSIVESDDIFRLKEFYNRALELKELERAELLHSVLEEYPEVEVNEAETNRADVLLPDIERLARLGSRPTWVLQTEKGEVWVRLNTASAPFTVSAIDSLTRAGLYDGEVFHRVIQNFVVQGGDYVRRDGLGQPEFRIPTEPSIHSFERGALGVASSGTDTEGSQFFFLHQWKPHLDGDYTLFGEVIRGMDVVDRLQVGDPVIKASILSR